MKQRILVIGLDGASPSLIQEWQEDLPNLRHLMEEGTHGVLKSVIPPRSIPAWYCFATGMNPAKIGVFGFSKRRPETYDYTFANLTFCRAPTFWQWLNRYGIKTVLAHIPGTFPPHSVQGAMVSGWPAPLNRGNLVYTHPPELSRVLDRCLDQPFEFVSGKPMRTDNDAEMLAERLRILNLHGKAACHVLDHQPWEVAAVVLSPVDRASHQFWRHMDPNHPAHDAVQAEQFSDALKRIYQAADEQVGLLLESAGKDATCFVVSDHGFGPAYRVFYLNQWLLEQGYLVLEEKRQAGQVSWSTRLVGRLSAPLFWLNNVSPVFRRLIEPFKKRAMSDFVREQYVRVKEKGRVRVNYAAVDWSRTRAYCPDEAALYLNLKGRDPEGIVEPGAEAEALLEEISAGLQSISDPQTGEPVRVSLYRKQDMYEGPFLEDAPELTVVMDDYTTEVMAEFGGETLFEPSDFRSGTHTLDGLFIARGPGITPGEKMDARLIDLAPTVVHLMGVPVPEESDGKVLLELFQEGTLVREQAVVQEPAGIGLLREAQVYSDEEQAQVEKQLKDLGYLG